MPPPYISYAVAASPSIGQTDQQDIVWQEINWEINKIPSGYWGAKCEQINSVVGPRSTFEELKAAIDKKMEQLAYELACKSQG